MNPSEYLEVDLSFVVRDFNEHKLIIIKNSNLKGFMIINDSAYIILKIISKYKKIKIEELISLIKKEIKISQKELMDFLPKFLTELADLGLVKIKNYKPKLNFEQENFKLRDFYEEYELIYHHNKILSANIELTSRCNLQCIHCIFPHSKKTKELSYKDIKKIAQDLKKVGVYIVVLSGGEPFIRKDIFDIINIFDKEGYLIRLNTNGSFINDKTISKIKDFKNIIKIQVSLYGGSKKTYEKITKSPDSYQKTINAIKLLGKLQKEKKNLAVDVSFSFLDDNYKEFGSIKRFCDKIGVKLGINGTIFPKADGDKLVYDKLPPLKTIKETFDSVFNKTEKYDPRTIKINGKKYLCAAGLDKMQIDASGFVFPCFALRGPKNCFGNMLNEDINAIIKKMRKVWPIKEEDTICNKCGEKDTCLEKCPAMSYHQNEDYYKCGKFTRSDIAPNLCSKLIPPK